MSLHALIVVSLAFAGLAVALVHAAVRAHRAEAERDAYEELWRRTIEALRSADGGHAPTVRPAEPGGECG